MRLRLLFLLLLSSCSAYKGEQPTDPVDLVFSQHEETQLRQYRMKLVAAGTKTSEEIDHFVLHYIAFWKADIESARKILVQGVETFLEVLQQSPELQEKLVDRPITARDIQYNINFVQEDGALFSPPHIAYAYLFDGVITYCYRDELFDDFIEEEDIEEMYEEALKKISEE